MAITIGRRRFVALVGGAAVWPVTARGQQPGGMRRIGVLEGGGAENDPSTQARIAALRDGLAKLGWVEERTLRIDPRFGGGDAGRIRIHAAELVSLAPDAIVTNTGGTGSFFPSIEEAARVSGVKAIKTPYRDAVDIARARNLHKRTITSPQGAGGVSAL